MRDEHITAMLDDAPLSTFSEGELAVMCSHAAGCAGCRRAFEAAQVSSLMLKGRAAEGFEPSPFFQTRVLAALREQRAANEAANESWTLGRLWKTAGLLVSSMAVTVAALAAFTFVTPQQATTTEVAVSSTDNSYSAEAVIFDEGGANDEEMSYGQVLTTLYGSDDAAVR
jgi:anti-sigma-K factor RskA